MRLETLRTKVSRRSSFGSKGAQQAGEDLGGFVGLLRDLRCNLLGQVAEANCDRELVFDFANRTKRHVEESNVISLSGACTTLDDVGRDRHRRPPKLNGQSELLVLGKCLRGRINRQNQSISKFKRTKLSMISHGWNYATSGLRSQASGLLMRVCSWESKRPPKPPHGVRLLALVLVRGLRLEATGLRPRTEGRRMK